MVPANRVFSEWEKTQRGLRRRAALKLRRVCRWIEERPIIGPLVARYGAVVFSAVASFALIEQDGSGAVVARVATVAALAAAIVQTTLGLTDRMSEFETVCARIKSVLDFASHRVLLSGGYRITLLLPYSDDRGSWLRPFLRNGEHGVEESAWMRIDEAAGEGGCEGTSGRAWLTRAPVERAARTNPVQNLSAYCQEMEVEPELAGRVKRKSVYYLAQPLLWDGACQAVWTIDSLDYGCLLRIRDVVEDLKGARKRDHGALQAELGKIQSYLADTLLRDLVRSSGIKT